MRQHCPCQRSNEARKKRLREAAERAEKTGTGPGQVFEAPEESLSEESRWGATFSSGGAHVHAGGCADLPDCSGMPASPVSVRRSPEFRMRLSEGSRIAEKGSSSKD